jgi:hypothetical protein
MSRVVLVHWNAAEGKERAATLRKAGHTAKVVTPKDLADFRSIATNPPAVLVIDLTRLPAQGREAAFWFRQRKATRAVPIVFAGGDPGKTAAIKTHLPDAQFTEWARVRGAVRRAIERAPAVPIVPRSEDIYQGRPLSKKLGFKADTVVCLLGAPRNFTRTLGSLPENVTLRHQARGHADLIMLFVTTRAELARRLPVAKRTMGDGGSLWIAWPKQTSKVTSDLTQQIVRSTGLGTGLVDYKICAIDDTWSGLRFARRALKR